MINIGTSVRRGTSVNYITSVGKSGINALSSGFVMPTTANHVGGYDASGVNSTVTGNPVTSITDASGNANNATGAADTPSISPNVINGLQAIRFDGTNDHLDLPAQGSWTGWVEPADRPFTCLLMASFPVVNENNSRAFNFRQSATPRVGIGTVSTSNISMEYYNGAAQDRLTHGLTLTTNTLYLILATAASDGTLTLNVNDGTAVTAANYANPPGTINGNLLGYVSSSGVQYDLCELHFFARVLTADEITQWTNYFGRWGTLGAAI